MVIEISDMDYRSYAFPCYPFDRQREQSIIKEFEKSVVVEISDKDYDLLVFPSHLSEWQLAA